MRSFGTNLLRIVLILLFAMTTCGAFGQGYALTSSTETFLPLSGATTLDNLEQDDHITGNIDIGFVFTYFGSDHTQLRISSNGLVIFGLDAASSPLLRDNVIATSIYPRIIAPLWDDLSGVGGNASYSTTGSAPNRIFTMEWLNWRWSYAASQSTVSFQLRLHETSNVIEFHYRHEAGTLNGPDASIGMIGNDGKHFYSLADASAAPSMSFNGNNSISTRPANGQRYRFAPVLVETPTVQASAIHTTVAPESASIDVTAGDGEYRAVFVKQTSSSEVFAPVNGTYYRASASFGVMSAGSGWFCVYNGKAGAFDISGLKSGLAYKIQIVEYNGIAGAQHYLASVANENPVIITTPLVRPSGAPSTVHILRVSGNEATFELKEQSGHKRAVFIKEKTGPDDVGPVPAVDDSVYSAAPVFAQGTEASGWYCVYNGISTSTVTVTGLSGGKDYRLQAVDYNGSPDTEKYYVTTENVVDFRTYYSIAVPDYSYEVTSAGFSPLSGATLLDVLRTDDKFSDAVGLGFTFWYGGVPFTELRASSDGFITFNEYVADAARIDAASENDLGTSLLRPLIAPLWDDLDGSQGQASYAVSGVAPDRIFTIEYLNWKWSYTATQPGISFQIKLYETTNAIEFIYRDEAGSVQDAAASVGMAFHNRGANNFLAVNNLTTSASVSKQTEQKNIGGEAITGLTYRFTPNRFDQTITLGIEEKTYGDPKFRINASVNSDQVLRFTTSDENVAVVSNDSITIVGAGETTITAYQDGDVNHNAAPPVARTLVVNKADQTITFDVLADKTFRDQPLPLIAETTSGLPVVFSSSDPERAEVVDNTVVIKGAGEFEIMASQPGNENYNPAPWIVQPLTVHKAQQTITFVLSDKTLGDESFLLNAVTDAELPITYTTTGEEILLEDNRVTLLQPGTISITALQAGDDNFEPSSASQTICVNPARPAIAVVPSNPWPFLLSSSETGNMWFKDNTLMQGEVLPSLAPPGTATYSVQVTIDGCTSLMSEEEHVIVTGSEEQVDGGFSVYPNPVQDHLTIVIPESNRRSCTITLTDLSGKLLKTESAMHTRSIDVHNLSAGVYHLRIQSGKKVYFKRVVKK